MQWPFLHAKINSLLFSFMLEKVISCHVMAAKNNIINVVMKKKKGTVSNINSGHKCRYVSI